MPVTPSITSDMVGLYGGAWRIEPEKIAQRVAEITGKVRPYSSLREWLVKAPRYHPVWHSYIISLMHLRPVEGLPQAIKYYSQATHEIQIWAIAPDWDLDALAIHGTAVRRNKDGEIEGLRLSPANFIGQFEATDEEAIARVERDIQDILDGKISPDTDYQSAWVERYGDHAFRLEHREAKGSA